MNRAWWRTLCKLSLAVAAAVIVPACDDDSDDGEAATQTLTTRGGDGLAGTNGNGGDSGYFYVETHSASNLCILKKGSVGTVATLPPITTPYLGTNAVTISTNTTWDVGDELTAGSNTVNVGGPVTGLKVAAGATLTIKPNWPAAGLRNLVQIDLNNGVIVEGTIVIDYRDLVMGMSDSNDCSDFTLYSDNLVVRSGGRILVRGRDVPGGTGGNGGTFHDYSYGTAINSGLISTKGGAGDDGGAGGGLYFGYGSYYGAYNTGTLEADGAVGAAGFGGDAGTLYFHADDGYGPCVNSGLLSARGGDGSDGGGAGGYVDLYSYYGIIASFGSILTNGGNATDPLANGNGGDGGSLFSYAYGETRFSGTVNTSGGNGAGTGGDGGSAGYVELYGDYDEDWGNGETSTFGMYIGASFDLSGGDGEYGGSGGDFYVYRYSDGYARPGKEPVYLVGYSTIDLSGGDGDVNGGYSDYVYIWAGYDHDETSTYYNGSVEITSDIVGNGGRGYTGTGGDTGYTDIETDSVAYTTQNSDYGVTISGNLTRNGGRGSTGGGTPDWIYVYGRYKAYVTGAITSNGGDTETGTAGTGGYVEVYSSLSVKCTGGITANGGSASDAAGDGGDAYAIYVAGLYVTLGGDISSNGGAGGSGSGTGGDGGYVEVISQENATVYSASVSVTAGSGFTDGTDGDFWLDGIHVAGP